MRRDIHAWGVDPHHHSDELWRGPQSISSIQVPDPAIVTALSDIDASTEEEGQERDRTAPEEGRDQEVEAPEEEDIDEDEIEAQFLARVKPPSRASSRAASASRRVFLAEEQGAADSAPAEGTSPSVGTGAAEPSAPKRRKKSTKIPAEEVANAESLSPPPASDSGQADPNWFVEHTHLESQYPLDRREPKQISKLPSVIFKGVYKHPPESLRRQTPKARLPLKVFPQKPSTRVHQSSQE